MRAYVLHNFNAKIYKLICKRFTRHIHSLTVIESYFSFFFLFFFVKFLFHHLFGNESQLCLSAEFYFIFFQFSSQYVLHLFVIRQFIFIWKRKKRRKNKLRNIRQIFVCWRYKWIFPLSALFVQSTVVIHIVTSSHCLNYNKYLAAHEFEDHILHTQLHTHSRTHS